MNSLFSRPITSLFTACGAFTALCLVQTIAQADEPALWRQQAFEALTAPTNGVDLEGAIAILETALFEEPQQPAARLDLAYLYFRLGSMEMVLRQAETALGQMSSDQGNEALKDAAIALIDAATDQRPAPPH